MWFTRRQFVLASMTLPFACRALARTRREPSRLDRTLDWLARHQNDDGTWSDAAFTDQCTKNACTGTRDTSVLGTTALAVNAFLHWGESHKTGVHKERVKAGLTWLVAQQRSSGRFGSGTGDRAFADHLTAAQTVVNAYGFTGSKPFEARAQASLDWTAEQQAESGAWGTQKAHVLATSEACRLLGRGRMAEMSVDDDVAARAVAWLEKQIDPETGSLDGAAQEATALAFLARTGLRSREANEKDALVATTVRHLAAQDMAELDAHALWLTTVALHRWASDEPWTRWFEALFELSDTRQSPADSGCANGSFAPRRESHGRVRATALGHLALTATQGYRRVFEKR